MILLRSYVLIFEEFNILIGELKVSQFTFYFFFSYLFTGNHVLIIRNSVIYYKINKCIKNTKKVESDF